MDPKDYRSYDTAIVTVLGSIYSSTISTVVFQTFFFYFRVESVLLSLPILICDIVLILQKKKNTTNSTHV